MCGILGIYSQQQPVNQLLFDGLTLLQHRGQDATGIVTLNKNNLQVRKSKGYVREVYRTRHMHQLAGNMGIAHVRYPTAGGYNKEETQPLYVNSPYGIALSHNGNITNVKQLAQDLYHKDKRHINTNSDSEVLLNVFADQLSAHGDYKLTPDAVFKSVTQLNERTEGAYATVCLIVGLGIVAFRDPCGLRPLIFGKRIVNGKTEWAVASESVALTTSEFKIERDVLPGEAIIIDLDGKLHTHICSPNPIYKPCIFEYVYFSRPDSIVDGISVFDARKNMGKELAKQILKDWEDHDIDVIMPVPDTSRTCAIEMSKILNIDYSEGLIKNRYIGRTFIMAGKQTRTKSVKYKLNPVLSEFKDKNVMLVDDSIVRGTTAREIISLAKQAGAKKIYMASASPPIRFPYVYGIDIPSKNDLIASQIESIDDIAISLGADKLIYQSLDSLKYAVKSCSPDGQVQDFDTSCFSGNYTTGDITDEYLKQVSDEYNTLRNKNL